MPLVQLLGAAADMWLPVAVVVLGGLALWFARARENPGAGTMVLLAISIVAVLLPLFGYWVSGRSHPNAIGGLLALERCGGLLRLCTCGYSTARDCRRSVSVVPRYSLYLAGLLRMASSELQLGVATKPVVEENRTIIGDLTIGGRSVGKNLACDCIEWRQSGGAKPRMNGAHNGAVCIRVAIERQDKTRCAQSCASAQRRVALQALPGEKIAHRPRQPRGRDLLKLYRFWLAMDVSLHMGVTHL